MVCIPMKENPRYEFQYGWDAGKRRVIEERKMHEKMKQPMGRLTGTIR